MLIPWPPSPLLVTIVLLLSAMSAMGVFAWVLLSKLESLRATSEQRIDGLNSRLRLIESRIERSSVGAAPTSMAVSAQDGLPGSGPRGSTRIASAVAPLPGDSELSEPRGRATLIAIPDLTAEEHEPDSQAEADLVQRHAEVWALAAAAMPPAEISRQTGQPIGQVELIVGLYRRLHSTRGRIDHARSV